MVWYIIHKNVSLLLVMARIATGKMAHLQLSGPHFCKRCEQWEHIQVWNTSSYAVSEDMFTLLGYSVFLHKN